MKSSTGKFYRIDAQSKGVSLIDTGNADLTNGDGLLLEGRTLYVFRNRQELIVPAELSEDFSSGTAGQGFTDESFMFPTTITRAADRMLVLINAQFDRGESGDPKLPFNITSVPAPE